ncbi:DUF2946 domain-containing protein [Bordetella genomosp. 5]|uniref:DUF2946 domain-containing protein n=1 Tax=Bordetella genomosp. 5 TaxID=1395608 RepID=A0A261T4X7_9BORD|nr:DUF2946 family protein [Bordetella genomosp. 5]OZI38835.1 DUF2946 domain-containing protein [Bordetella genomosp. 5]OZI44150.1 hypothetical protein CAL25_22685 [Bordetella genomosp. 5]
MTSTRPHRSARYVATLWLALVLFALKALVPPGYMPGTHVGANLIELCSATGRIFVQAPESTHQQADERHAAQAAACPVGAAVAAVPMPPSLPALTPVSSAHSFPFSARAPPARTHYTFTGAPLGARAPPSSLV